MCSASTVSYTQLVLTDAKELDQMDQSKSSGKQSRETTDNLLSELIATHLQLCSECDTSARPVGLGQTSKLCARYWALLQAWADHEGKVNNIVAHDEFGNEALPAQENSDYWFRHGAP